MTQPKTIGHLVQFCERHPIDEATRASVEPGSFSFGIEEEFFLIDRATGRVAQNTPPSLFTLANLATRGAVERELLQSQVEAVTPPFDNVADAAAELRYVRGVLSSFASFYNLELAAVGTHPFSRWRDSRQSQNSRHAEVMDDLQLVGRRNVVCGMHVHVEVPNPNRRVELMTRLCEYLPLFIALSTSSPFWQGEPSGLKGYRLAANGELPRSGMPEYFTTGEDYDRYVRSLERSSAIKDASYVWWMVRPSLKYPTLELRAPDSCTRVEDTIAIASLYRSLVRHLYYAPQAEPPDPVIRALAVENKWQAQRRGTSAVFASLDGPKNAAEFLEDVLSEISEDAEALGCVPQVGHCRTIIALGSSADKQLEIYDRSPDEDGLRQVARWISVTTVGGRL